MSNIVKDLQEMQNELKELRSYKKAVQKFIQKGNEFLDEKQSEKVSEFEQTIRDFYGLKNERDLANFCSVMLNESSKNFWQSRRETN